ncbi:MAG: O-antigen ligase family protein [Oscillospiraceae bacterium]|nr:O-antigen ligase family protein [Oscillospiraceae bacterium]
MMMNFNNKYEKGRFFALFSNKKYIALYAFATISILLFGQYHFWSAFLGGAYLAIAIIITVIKKQYLNVSFGLPTLLIHLVVLSYFVSIIWAIDKGMATLGFFKYLTVSLIILLADGTAVNKNKILETYATIAGLSVILCCLLSFIPSIRREVFYGGRLGGTFLYANSYGLYLLLSMVIISTKETMRKIDYFFCFIIGLGIILTGSRSIFVISIVSILLLFFINKRAVVSFACGALLASLLSFWFNNVGGIQRSISISLSSGEMLNRLAYYYDGSRLIINHPFGLGHYGWWYVQTSIQSSLYNVRLIHNWVLQLALDVGIVPTILLATSVLIVAFHKNSILRTRLLILLIFGHSLIDYNLAFLSTAYIAIMAMQVDKNMVKITNRKALTIIIVVSLVLLCIYICLGAATFLSFIGNDTTAVRLYPFYTEAMEKIIITESDPDEAFVWAERILVLNPYVHDAYDVKARVYASKGLWLDAVDMKREFIMKSRLNGSDYDELLIYIHFALIEADANGDYDAMNELIDLALSIPSLLDNVTASLNPLAYRLRHKPTLFLSEDSLRYLEYLYEYQAALLDME